MGNEKNKSLDRANASGARQGFFVFAAVRPFFEALARFLRGPKHPWRGSPFCFFFGA
jgi:hypothetical protein